MEEKKNIWFEKNKDIKIRDRKSDADKKAYEKREANAFAAGEYVVRKSVVDFYSMKVPFSSI